MSIHTSVHHLTHYKYQKFISVSPQIIRLRPAPHCKVPILSYSLKIEPSNHYINWLQDLYGNYLARIIFPDPIKEFKIEVEVLADVRIINPFDFFLEENANKWPFSYGSSIVEDLSVYRKKEDLGPLFNQYLNLIPQEIEGTVDFLVAINAMLEREIQYLIRMEPGVQNPEETLHLKSGSCRDSAWLLIHILRHLGFAARFVSGYLLQLKADEKPLEGPAGTEEDFTDLHAWAEVYLPGAGWIGLDPTSGLLTGEGHIPLACSPHYENAAPIEGFVKESVPTEFDFQMNIKRVWERPRVTAPIMHESWKEIQTLCSQLDQEIIDQDIRLTVGGEPTFVSLDNRDLPEWNIDAVGEDKQLKSDRLLRSMSEHLSAGYFLHYGQGKWYPGESLPRWSMGCYWRKDGKPLWRNPKLLADLKTDYKYTQSDAKSFLTLFAEIFELGEDHIFAAYEDTWYYLWKENQLPENVTPTDSKLKDPEERVRLSKIFKKGLDEPKGFVLPMQKLWQATAKKWVSSDWTLRRENMFLIPGDSPLGLRLPLASLPWIEESSYPHVVANDPLGASAFSNSDSEKSYNKYLQFISSFKSDEISLPEELRPRKQKLEADEAEEDSESKVRTAISVECREGRLHVFIPPVSDFSEYAELLAGIEVSAEKLKVSIFVEGDPPPFDSGVEYFRITPDPGVVEVNIHPAHTCVDFIERMEVLFKCARDCRLGTEKFLIDGTRVSTGGGHHIVMGGPKPEDSPFLRRPDLLRSLVTYWLQHPALSYLFAGLHIGPTSQSPRIDESRHDSIYELEIAFRSMKKEATLSPWLVDRLFRNLLIDVSGNTHRAEFCIDKLYNPELSSGRLGLLELRAFEMLPHPKMSSALHCLVVSLLVHFWKNPLEEDRLPRWGTSLHDRWMLPHFLVKDLNLVIEDLQSHDLPVQKNWFSAHQEFRFPIIGQLNYQEISLELRSALEPWNVLGESGLTGGTVRFVDSSLERIQIKLNHWNPNRFQLLCNQIKVPLTATGEQGEYVAGVRFRAWQPPECLHPNIEVDAPLVFDIINIATNRSVSGCTYRVSHPGGRSFEDAPVNDFEAEGRKLSRFEAMGHTPGENIPIRPTIENPEYPMTLDMRLYAR